MEKLSRVKKYEKLREEIETESTPMSHGSEAIKEFQKKNEIQEENYTPVHEKRFITKNDVEKESEATFRNEYLDSFIQEVRDYNLKKGTREYEDTKFDILQQLNTKNREKRSQYIERIEEDTSDIKAEDNNVSIPQTNEISKQVMDLISDVTGQKEANENDDTVSEDNINDENALQEKPKIMTLEERISSLENQIMDERSETIDLSESEKQELLEETMQLKIQMNEYKEELDELNSGIDSNNRLLNMIITILIIALLAVIGVVVYWLISGGII